ncbi:MAG: hypothetical protein JSU73_02200 [candidate division WOR-3 bacterium]|nr:MAG: hypothetical protein JSU73_02200 [candidate division WOR-3 bacterium]
MSSDRGEEWEAIDDYYDDGGALVVDPYDSRVYWSGGVNGGRMIVSRTTDRGESWQRYDLAGGYARALAIDPLNTDFVYAGGNPGLFRTTDRGATWRSSSSGLTGEVRTIAVHPADGDVVYVGTEDGVFKSTDAGAGWRYVGCRGVNALAFAGFEPCTVFVGTDSGVSRSADGSVTWSPMNEGLDSVHITTLGVVAGSGLYAGTQGASMYVWPFPLAVEEEKHRRMGGLLSVCPCPAAGPVVVRYAVASLTRVRVTVYDASGRKVHSLVDGCETAGVHTVTWHGRDGSGRRLPEGLYLIELAVEDRYCLSKVVRLR